MKRFFCYLLLVVFVLGAFTGCAKKTATNTDAADKLELTFSFWEPGTERELETALAKVAAAYEEVNPNVKIKFLSQPVNGYQESGYRRRLLRTAFRISNLIIFIY